MEAPQPIQNKFRTALQEFLNEPTTPTEEFLQILQLLKAKVAPPPPAPETNVAQKHQASNKPMPQVVDENEERKNRMIKSIETRVERKRRDIQEKYRKRMYYSFIPFDVIAW